MAAQPDDPLDWTLDLALPLNSRKRIAFVADERQRDKIAHVYGLPGLKRFEAQVEVAPWTRHGVRLDARLIADAVQECVVSLEPVESAIDESFSRTFISERGAARRQVAEEGEIEVAYDEEDPPDVLTGSRIALGPVMLEQFVLALDPYPRREGATPDAPADDPADDKETAESPFAVLQTLQQPKPDNDGN